MNEKQEIVNIVTFRFKCMEKIGSRMKVWLDGSQLKMRVIGRN